MTKGRFFGLAELPYEAASEMSIRIRLEIDKVVPSHARSDPQIQDFLDSGVLRGISYIRVSHHDIDIDVDLWMVGTD